MRVVVVWSTFLFRVRIGKDCTWDWCNCIFFCIVRRRTNIVPYDYRNKGRWLSPLEGYVFGVDGAKRKRKNNKILTVWKVQYLVRRKKSFPLSVLEVHRIIRPRIRMTSTTPCRFDFHCVFHSNGKEIQPSWEGRFKVPLKVDTTNILRRIQAGTAHFLADKWFVHYY